jgi:hypothetical protein
MYCPSCGEKFDWTVTECPECGVELVETRPGPPADPSIELTTVFSSGDPALIALAKSLLEAEDIEYFIRAEAVQDLLGWGRIGAGYNIATGPTEFVVRDDDAERARELLHDLATPVHEEDGPEPEEA